MNINYDVKMKDDQDTLNVLRTLRNKPRFSQRDLAKSLGFSLGKLNYVLRSLQEKGLVKIRNFQTVNTSFPGFISLVKYLGGKVEIKK